MDPNPSPNLLEALRQSGNHTPLFDLSGRETWARLVHVHDGDTVSVCVDLGHVGGDGPYDVKRLILRMTGIDAPEIRTHDADEKRLAIRSRAHLLNRLAPHLFDVEKDWSCEKDITDLLRDNLVLVYVKMSKFDKFSRVLTDIFEQPDDRLSLNQWMLDNKLADAYDGGHKERTWDHST